MVLKLKESVLFFVYQQPLIRVYQSKLMSSLKCHQSPSVVVSCSFTLCFPLSFVSNNEFGSIYELVTLKPGS